MRMPAAKIIASLLLLIVAALSCAENGTIQLTSLPTLTVADGRSTVTISAYLRRPSGQAVADGTQVIFSTTLGSFRDDSIVQTQNGVARVVLQTGSVAGTAKITATALGIGAITTLDLEFLSDRSLLSSAKEYIEVVSPNTIFSMDQRILGASGPNHGAKLRYREIEIEADDIQLNVPAYEVRAKKAHLKMGKVNQEFEELNIKLRARTGFGTTTLVPKGQWQMTAFGRTPVITAAHNRFGVGEIHTSGVTPAPSTGEVPQFRFEDLSESTSIISARKAVVFPQKEIQFQKAEMIVGGAKLMKWQLYVLNLNSPSNVVTDQIFNVNNSQLNLNYPYYISLRPGETSLLRLTTGTQYGRTGGVDKGMSLNYEMNWNRGDDFDGGFALTSLTSRNWDINAHQYIRFDDRTSITAFLDAPEGRSIYGNLNFSKQFGGFGLSMNSSTSHNFRGARFDNAQTSLVLEKDPMRIGNLPLRFTYGLNASASATRTSLQAQSQDVFGLHLRTQLIPVKLDGQTQFNSYVTVSEQEGRNSVKGIALQGNASLSRQFGKYASGLFTYDYLQNGFNSGLTGRHQVSLSGQYHQGNFGSTVYAIKALDIDKVSLFADLGYQLSGLWRLSYSYTLDRYIGNTYVDYTAAIGYRIGFREVGLTYSGRTRHFGIELLGTPIGP